MNKKQKAVKSKTARRKLNPPQHPYFGIPEHKVSISAEDFISGKMPAIVKRANKVGHMVTLSVK